ncbi:MAG TPA: hypothetical protein VF490_01185 [Chryseosolibacter sp.]
MNIPFKAIVAGLLAGAAFYFIPFGFPFFFFFFFCFFIARFLFAPWWWSPWRYYRTHDRGWGTDGGPVSIDGDEPGAPASGEEKHFNVS